MNQTEVEAFVTQMDNVQREDNFGYSFFFVGDDHRLAFVTVGHSDNEFDAVSNLSREGVFRINIGVSRKTFESLFAGTDMEKVDYAALNVFMPHPHYARQNFICILNPAGENIATTQSLIVEAHTIAAARRQRKNKE